MAVFISGCFEVLNTFTLLKMNNDVFDSEVESNSMLMLEIAIIWKYRIFIYPYVKLIFTILFSHQKLLELDEAKMWSRKVDERDQRFAVTISDATFTWQSVPANVRSVDIVRERFKVHKTNLGIGVLS